MLSGSCDHTHTLQFLTPASYTKLVSAERNLIKQQSSYQGGKDNLWWIWNTLGLHKGEGYIGSLFRDPTLCQNHATPPVTTPGSSQESNTFFRQIAPKEITNVENAKQIQVTFHEFLQMSVRPSPRRQGWARVSFPPWKLTTKLCRISQPGIATIYWWPCVAKWAVLPIRIPRTFATHEVVTARLLPHNHNKQYVSRQHTTLFEYSSSLQVMLSGFPGSERTDAVIRHNIVSSDMVASQTSTACWTPSHCCAVPHDAGPSHRQKTKPQWVKGPRHRGRSQNWCKRAPCPGVDSTCGSVLVEQVTCGMNKRHALCQSLA